MKTKMKKISQILFISLCLISFDLNASLAPLKRATGLFSTIVKSIKIINLSTLKEATSIFTKENAQRAHTLLNLSLAGYISYLFKENYPQRMVIDDCWVSPERKDLILKIKRRKAHQILTVLGVTATGAIRATQHLSLNQKNIIWSAILTSFLTHLTVQKLLPQGMSEKYDAIKAVIHEYPKTIPAAPECFKLVNPATTKDSIFITWDVKNFPKHELITSSRQIKLQVKAFAKAQQKIETIVRSCGIPGKYVIRIATMQESFSGKFYAEVKQEELKVIISLSQFMIHDIMEGKTGYFVYTIWHEMGHVIWKHGPESYENVHHRKALNKKNILYHFFHRSIERQANKFSLKHINTLDLEIAKDELLKYTCNKDFKDKITDFFSKTHPDANEQYKAMQKELQKRRKIQTSHFHAVVSAENKVRSRNFW